MKYENILNFAYISCINYKPYVEKEEEIFFLSVVAINSCVKSILFETVSLLYTKLNFGFCGKLFKKEEKDVYMLYMCCGKENMTVNLKSRSSPSNGMPCIALSNALPGISMRIQHFSLPLACCIRLHAIYLLFFSRCIRFHLSLRRTTRAKLC